MSVDEAQLDSALVRIAVGSDHAGRELKDLIASHLGSQGHDVEDLGTYSDESVDYPDYAALVGRAVTMGGVDAGICFCGTGIGIAIAANKVAGVRAATVHDATTGRLAREHNNANVICLGGRTVGSEVAIDAVDAFVSAAYAGGRHDRRIDKIARLEEEM